MGEVIADVGKVPPQSLEAEQSTLGAMLIDRDAIAKALEILGVEDFYRDAHKIIFEAITKLFERGEPVDLITVTEELRKFNKLDEVGGVSYITALIESVPTAANVEYYAKIVEDKAILRNLIDSANQIAKLGYEGAVEGTEEAVDKAEQLIFGVGQRRLGEYFVPIKSILTDTFERIEERYRDKKMTTGIPTGFIDIDKRTGGFQPADLIVIASRPGMGKTALCLNVAEHIAVRERSPVAIFSLEMSAEQLGLRMLCSVAKVDQHALRTGFIKDEEWVEISKAMGILSEAPIYVDDTANLSALEIRAKARRLRAEHGLGLIIVDYLQLVRGDPKAENRVQQVSQIARGLKSLGRELDVPVIAISQLSRAVEQRTNKRPILSDLRESGSIEAEADLVAFLYRESYYEPEVLRREITMPEGDLTEFIIAKQRNGPIGLVNLVFFREWARFASYMEEYEVG